MSTRKLEIELIGDSSSLSKSFRGAVRDADTFGSRLRHAGVMGAKVLGGALVAGAAAGTYAIVKSAEAAEEANKVHAQTGAVLKSTGHAAGVSQKQVENLAESIMRKTGIDDEAILTGQNLLLTFKNIKNEAGAGNNVFDQATHAMVDMSAAMGNDASSSAIQLGKALNDPIKGISALSKVGVSFSDQQKEQIEQWVESGETLRAQKAILKELNSEFGGSAAAQATAMEKIKTSIGNVEESFGNVFLPIIDEAATKLNRDFVPELQHTADGLARIAARKNIDMGEKLGLAEDLVKRQWGDVPEQIGHLVDEAVPIVAERSGQLGVAAAKGMAHGFIDANPLGKASILLLASKAFGGPAGLIGAGRMLGSKLGGTAAAGANTALAAGLGGAATGGVVAKASKSGLASALGRGLGKGILGAAGGLIATELAVEGLGAFGVGDPTEGQGLLPSLTHGFNTSGVAETEGRVLTEQKELEKSNKTLRQGLQGLESGRFTRPADIRTMMERNTHAAQEGSGKVRDALAKNYRAGADAIEIGMRRGVVNTKTGMEEIRRYTRDAHLISGDDPWGIAKGFARTWDKAGGITKQNLNRITQDLGKMPEPAAQATAQMMLGMAREMRSKGQLTRAEVERLRSAVVTKLGLMATQAGKKGDAFRANLGAPIGGLSIDVAEALENMGVNVGALLEKLGADNPLMGFTMKYFQGHGGGGKGKKYLDQVPEFKAQGGPVKVPGQGLHDTVPLFVNGSMSAVVAPGEKLAAITQHQSPLLDRAVANEYGVAGLDGFFKTFDRPHWMARGGLAPEPRVGGPNPLRGGAQRGIHRGHRAAEEYLRAHRPKPTGGGVAGYSGPPANMKQLGDNAYVDSHTLAVTAALDRMFGLTMSSGYRSPAHNAAIGGASGSLHTHGSPANPGATDSVGELSAMNSYIAFARKHVAGLQEAMVDNYAGLGYNAHLGFFDKGGVVTGKVSYFGGGATAGGSTTSVPGVALNLDPGNEPGGWNNDKTQGWMSASNAGHPVYAKVTIGGKTANLPITDLGPASWTGRSIDVTEGGVRKLGLDPGAFPTDSIGKAVILDGSGGGGKGKTSSGKPKFHPHPGKTGKGGGTEGPGGRYPKGTAKTHGESVPGMAPSPALPSASALPQSIQNLLTAPGMDYAGRTAIGDLALQQAGRTEGTDDDRAAYNFQEELLKRKKQRLQKALAEVRAKLKKRHTKAEETKLLARQSHILSELGSVETGLGSVREGRAGLDEAGEAEEDPAVKAAEEAKRAAEEMKAAADQLKDEMQKTRQIAESELAVGLTEARRALADMISAELGPRSYYQAQTAGAGTVGTL